MEKHSRVMTRNLEASSTEDVFNLDASSNEDDVDTGSFKSFGVDPLKSNSPSTLDSSSIVSLSSFSQVLPAKKVHQNRKLVVRPLKRMSTYLKRNQCFKRRYSSRFTLLSELAVKGSKLSGRCVLQRYRKYKVKVRKVCPRLIEAQPTPSKKKIKSCQFVSESSPVPASLKTGISHIVSTLKPTKRKFGSSTPIATRHSSSQQMHLPKTPENNINIDASTPPVQYNEIHGPYYRPSEWEENVIFSSRSTNTFEFLPSSCSSTSDYGSGNYRVFVTERNFDDVMNNDDLNVILPSDQLLPLDNEPVISERLTYSDDTVDESNLTACQSTRSEELFPAFDISELNDLTTKRSLDSLDKLLPLDNEPVISKRLTYSDDTVDESNLTACQSTRSEELFPAFDISELNDLSTKRSLDSLDKLLPLDNEPVISKRLTYSDDSVDESNLTACQSTRSEELFPAFDISELNDLSTKRSLDSLDKLLPLDNEPVISKRLTYSDDTVDDSNLTTCQSTRSKELLPTFDISELNDLSTKRSLDALEKVDADGLDCLNSYTRHLFKLLKFCKQDHAIGFEDVFDWSRTAIRKIGEGTYGEVFIITQKKCSSVIKVIPILDLNTRVPGIQPIENVYSELKIAHCLSKLGIGEYHRTKNFNKLKSAKVVKGAYPSKMLVAWDTFSEAKTTDNPRPDVFAEDQLYAVLELEYGGKDMTEFVMRNAAEADCIFQQVLISLAIAEEACSFEHRNLCLENILVRRNSTKFISYIIHGSPFSIKNHGLVVTITDFSFSKALVSGSLFYNDLANEESLFHQSGDLKCHVYRVMRELLNDEWQKSALNTNVMWLRFLCYKLRKSEYSHPTIKKHRKSMKSLLRMLNIMPYCASADIVFFHSDFEVCEQ